MIKCENGLVKMQGDPRLLMADLTTTVHAMHYDVFIEKHNFDPEHSREMIIRAVEQGFSTEEEIENELKESLLELLDKLKELIEGKDDK